MNPLPLGEIKPKGWLKQQLQIQADGLSGHLDEFWPDLGPNSGWLGGDGESWERGPYYLDGLIPLAYLLEDTILIAKAQKWIDWVLDNQGADGRLGPERNTDWWPLAVILKALTQYQEVTGDPRVIPALDKFFQYQLARMPEKPLEDWGNFRWADMALSAIWLYRKTQNPALLQNMKIIQKQGYDWTTHFSEFHFIEKTKEHFRLDTHVVNSAMGVKAPAVSYAITRNKRHLEISRKVLDVLDLHHGQVNGLFSGDEHYAGKEPTQGTELCAVVELMFSLETLLELQGDACYGDRLEKVTFNALPATFSPDMWAHQYDQQVNQVLCTVAKREWTNNGDDSNIFGLEPNYGCCTSNMHQGWPKFTSHLWMSTQDGGLAAIAYAPCEISTMVHKTVPVQITVETEYPFDETIRIRIGTKKPIQFPLHLRIPAWIKNAEVLICGKPAECIKAGSYLALEKTWLDGDFIELRFPMQIQITRGLHDSAVIERGPLVFSLKMGEDWHQIKGTLPHADFEIHPTTPWNYALAVDTENPEPDLVVIQNKIGRCPFSPEGSPLEIHVKGRCLPEWGMKQNSAGPVPQSPVRSNLPSEDLILIPYGCTNLRVTEFPLLEE